jgi:hypothetical protein
MLAFTGTLVLLQQFYDRLRQRLEHLDRALMLLPRATTPSPQALAQAQALFPLHEERAALAETFGVTAENDQAPAVELFT